MKSYEIMRSLVDRGYEAYFIGGYVRNLLKKIKTEDIDIVTSARPNDILSIFDGHCKEIKGSQFTIVMVDGIDVATFRKDSYKNNNKVEITYSDSLEEDTNRRDLTINAIAMDINGKFYDYHNGIEDLKEDRIRFIGKPGDRMFEDPVRIIRACRFLALINGRFDKATYNGLKMYSNFVKLIKKERIREEILKAMKIKTASVFFRTCQDIDILKYIFPSLSLCVGVSQNIHHLEELFHHNMMTGDNIACKLPLLKLVGYLHDVGKVNCKVYDAAKHDNTFYAHEKIGSDIVRDELKDLTFSNKEISYIYNLIKLHMRTKPTTNKGARKELRVYNEHNLTYQDMMRLKLADHASSIPTRECDISYMKSRLRGFRKVINEKEPFTAKNLEVDGHDVMSILKIKPGPIVGKTLEVLLKLVNLLKYISILKN